MYKAALFLCLLPIFAASCADKGSGVALGIGAGGAAFVGSGTYMPSLGAWGGRGFRESRSFGGIFLGFPLIPCEPETYIPPARFSSVPAASSAPPLTPAATPPISPGSTLPPAPTRPPSASDVPPPESASAGNDHLPVAVLSRNAWEYHDAVYRSRLADR